MGAKFQDLSKFHVPAKFRGRSIFFVQIWWFVQSTLFRMSPQVAYEWRNFLLRCFGARIGKGVKIRPTVNITYPWKLTIGNHSWVGDDCNLYSLGNIFIGNNVALAHGVYVCTGTHDYSSISFDILSKEVVIEDEVWLPNDVFVGPGVRIGYGAIVGARSTVIKDLPGGMICIGNPAKPIRPRPASTM